MVTDYKIVKCGAHQLSQLEDEVKQFVNKGWQPHGTLQIIMIDKQTVLVQPLTLSTTYGSLLEK